MVLDQSRGNNRGQFVPGLATLLAILLVLGILAVIFVAVSYLALYIIGFVVGVAILYISVKIVIAIGRGSLIAGVGTMIALFGVYVLFVSAYTFAQPILGLEVWTEATGTPLQYLAISSVFFGVGGALFWVGS